MSIKKDTNYKYDFGFNVYHIALKKDYKHNFNAYFYNPSVRVF